jgi:hypothetical protein
LRDEELAYLVGMVIEGLESMACVPPEYAEKNYVRSLRSLTK